MILSKAHFADVADRVARDELTPGEAYKLLGRIQLDQDNQRQITAEDKIEMARLYVERQLGCDAIASQFNCAVSTVRHHLKTVGVELRSPGVASRKKLSDDDIRDIRSSKEVQSVLARRYGVSPSLISAIRSGRSRAAVTDFTLPEGLEGTRQALNMLPALNEAIDDNLRAAKRHAESTRGLLRTVANTAPSE